MTKSIKLLELFSGIQAQERALRQIGVPYESVGVCDCDKDVLVSAAAMRFDLEKEIANYNFPSVETMIAELQNKNIGYSFEKEKHTITNRTPINKLKQYYISDKLLNNLGDISKVERLPYADLVTYSSPCQSFSVAGKLGGATKTCKSCGHKWEIDFSNPDYNYKCPICGNASLESTTSGLLSEVQRLLSIAYENNELPRYLLLENVKNLVGKKFVNQFNAWIKWLDSIGYNTYYEVLNAKHYGIPQNRERIFALSIRKDVDNGEFKFPDKIPLNIRLKDILEKNVDEKYYLPDDRIDKILNSTFMQEKKRIQMKDVCDTLLARDWKDPKCVQVEDPFIVASRGRNPDNPSDRTTGAPTEQRFEANYNGTTNCLTSVQKDNYVCEPTVYNVGNIYPSNGQNGNIYDADGISPTINAGVGIKGRGIGSNNAPKVIISEPVVYDDYNSRISSDQDAINTLTTNCGASAERNGVKILEPIVCEERRDEGIRLFKDDCVGTLRTIDACGDKRVIEPDVNPQLVGGIGEKNFGKQYRQGNRVYDSDAVAMALNAQPVGNTGGYSYLYTVEDEYTNIRWRIRKLTPKECWRLMGFTDEDNNKASCYVSASSLYKQAGNSICTCCLVAIFNALFLQDYTTSYEEKLVNYNNS